MRLFTAFLFLLLSATVFGADESFIYDDHGKRDPLWRLVSPDGVIMNFDKDLLVSDMILEGIIFDPNGKSLAIVNGNVVKVDDMIGLFAVSKIEQKKVILSKDQETFILELKKEE